MEISQLSFTVLVVILFGLLSLIVLLGYLRMPKDFHEKEMVRSRVRKRLNVIQTEMRKVTQKKTDDDQVS